MNNLGTLTLKTARLVLRPFRVDDYKDMYKNWVSSEVVSRYMTWEKHKDEQETKKTLEQWVKNYETNDFYNWCITLNGEPIGSIGIAEFDNDTLTAKTGYCISEKHWGKGFVTECYSAVLNFLFKEVGINKVSTYHDIRNVASGRVMEKCGLKEVRTENTVNKGEKITISIKEITKAEFLALNP